MRRVLMQTVATGLVLAVSCLDLHAGIITWSKGAGTLSWNTAANWNSNAVPGAADTAKFTPTGLADNDTVTLDANQTVASLDLAMNKTNVTISSGGGFGLTLATGGLLSSAGVGNAIINAPITLGAAGSFAWGGASDFNKTIQFLQPIDDGGNNYGLTLSPADQPMTYVFTGNNTYGSTTVIRCYALVLRGPNGAITNSTINLTHRRDQTGALSLDNTFGVNNDRVGDNKDIVVDYEGGQIGMYGASATPVAEQAGTVWLNRGRLNLYSSYGGTNVQLKFAGFNRTPGTAMSMGISAGTAGTNNQIGFAGATNVNGIWQPYVVHNLDYPYRSDFVKVNALGWLMPLGDADYTTFPTSGADSTKVYRITTTNPVALAASQSVYALNCSAISNTTIQLGAFDLRVVCGAILAGTGGGPAISSSGGRLLFGGDEMLLSAVRFTSGSDKIGTDTFTLNCPILCEGTGIKRVVVVFSRTAVTYSLLGQDLNGTYGSIYGWPSGSIELGGSSDRTVTEYLNGKFTLLKSGSGTLQLAGVDQRGYVSGPTTVRGGRLVLSNNLALAAAPTVTNAILEIASGVTNSIGATLQYGATLTGDGCLSAAATFTNGVHVSPGHAVGKLTLSGATTFRDGAHIDWDLGNGTTTPGTDYDLLFITNSLTLPASPATITLHVRNGGTGSVNPKGVTFTVAQWTSTDPASRPIWQIVNDSPNTFDTSGVTITVTNAPVKKILLTGLKQANRGSAVFFR